MELKGQKKMKYTNNKNNPSGNYYYINISNKNESTYNNYNNNYHSNNNNIDIENSINSNEYFPNFVNKNNNIHTTNNTSIKDRYSSNLPYVSPHHPSSYLHDSPSYSSRMEHQSSFSLPPPNSLLSTEKTEFKNVYVKIKSKRVNDRYDNDPIFDPEHMKYSKEEIKQLKKELNIEFNGVDTLEEFKKLNQNEQKKLIIQICRFLMSMYYLFIYLFFLNNLLIIKR